MTDSQDRRSAVRRLAAGVGAAALAAQGRPGAADADLQSSKDSGRPVEIFRGTMPSPVYIPIGEEGTDRYVIVADGCAGRMRNCNRGDSRHMGSDRLYRYLQRKSGGEFSGLQTFRLEGINWRPQGLEEDPETGQWRTRPRSATPTPTRGRTPSRRPGRPGKWTPPSTS